jgi:hypothetical protein
MKSAAYPKERVYRAVLEFDDMESFKEFLEFGTPNTVPVVDGIRSPWYLERFKGLFWKLKSPIVLEAEITFRDNRRSHESITLAFERKNRGRGSHV